MSARPRPASVPGWLLRRYRAGTSVSVLAKELGVSFDWVAQRVIAAGTRRDRPAWQIRRRPIELDSDEWLSGQLASGAGVRDLSRRLRVSRSTIRHALHDYAERRVESGAGGDPGETDPIHRFTTATERLERARVALDRARMLQASAVRELHRSGLTINAIADRLGVDEHVVETLLSAVPTADDPCCR